MGLKRRTILKGMLAATVLAMGVILLGLVQINLSFIKDNIAQYARDNLDLDVTIQGPLRLRLGPDPRIEAAAIEIRKAGAVDEVLLRVEALSVHPRLFEMLRGRIHLKAVQVAGAQFDYCAALPSFGDDNKSNGTLPSIAANTVMAANLHLFCGSRRNQQTPDVFIGELYGSASASGAMAVAAQGRVNDLPVELEAHSGNLNALLTSPDDFPVWLGIATQGAEFRLDGAIDDPLGQFELRAGANLQVENPRRLMSDLGVSIPEVAAFEFSGQAWLNIDAVGIENLIGKIGDSDIAASGLARFSAERSYYEVNARLSRLHRDLFGSAPAISTEKDDWETFDLQPLYDTLSEFDAKIHVAVDELTVAATHIENLDLDASLNDGSLVVSRYRMHFMGSRIEAEASLDMQGECGDFRARGQTTGVDLQRLAELLDKKIPLAGNLDQFEFDTHSCGNTLTEHRNTLQVEVDVSGAKFSYENLDLPLKLDTLKVNAGWARPSRAILRGQLLDENLSIEIHGGSIEKLVAGLSWPMSLEMTGAGTHMTLDGNAAIGADSAVIDAVLDVAAPHIGSLHRWIDVDPASELPLSVNASIQWNDGSISIDDFDAALGQSAIKGRLESANEDTELILVTELRSAGLDVMELKSVFLPTRHASQSSAQPNKESNNPGLDLPSVNLDLHIERLHGTQFDIRDVDLQGTLRNQLIEDANFRVRLDEFPFAGAFTIDFHDMPAKVSYQATATDLDIGRLLQELGLVDDARITAEALNIDYSSHGMTVREILLNGDTLAEFRNVYWDVERQDKKPILDLDLTRLAMHAAPNEPAVWEATGLLDGVPLNAWAETPPLENIFDGEEKSPLTVVVSSGNNVAMLSGDIDWSNPGVFSADLALSGARMNPENVDFAQLKSPLEGFELSADLTISDREISVAGLTADIGTSHASGYAKVNISENGRKFEMRLQAPRIETDDFVELANALREYRQDDEDADLLAVPEAPDLKDIVREYIEAQTLDNSFDVQIGIDGLYSGNRYLGGAQLGVLADQDNFRLQPITVALPSGNIDAEYVVERTADGVDSFLNIYIERLQYGDLVRLIDPDEQKNIRGFLYLDTSLTSSAPTTGQLPDFLQGRIDSLTIPEDIAAGVLDVWAANLVLTLVTPKGLSQPKKLNCIVANFSVDEGVMRSRYVVLDTTDVIIRGRGKIDVANHTIDMIVAPQAKREKFLSVSTPIAIEGPWDDVQVGVTKTGFVATLFRLYLGLIYVPFKWLTGERFPADGLTTCFDATDWELPDD